jgi:hypothetical protein
MKPQSLLDGVAVSFTVRRLLDDAAAADYLGVSRAYMRQLVANGSVRRVELPATDGSGGRARMTRIDVRDLDSLIERLKV